MHMFGHHYVGENNKVQPVTRLGKDIQKEIGTAWIEKTLARGGRSRTSARGHARFVDADPSHV